MRKLSNSIVLNVLEIALWVAVFCLMSVKPGHTAIIFDGVDDSITFGTGDVMPEESDYSLYWRGTINSVAADDGIFFYKVGSGVDGEGAALRFDDPTGIIRFWKEGATTYLTVLTSTTIPTGSEFVLIATVSGGGTATGTKIYINGSEASYSEQANGVDLANSAGGNLVMGETPGGGDALPGTTREAAIFSHILTSGEISALSNGASTAEILAMSPSRYWPMGDGESGTSADGDTVGDISGNAGHGTGSDGANNTGLTWSNRRRIGVVQ